MTIKKEGLGNGTYTEPFADHRQSGTVHTIQLWFRDANGDIGAPAAGTVTIKARAPGGPAFEALDGNLVDVTDRANWLQELKGMHIEALELTLASVTTDYTMGYAISSSFGGA